ncbi:baseplate J/gp47 family protein [Gluconobacter sp. LMG 1744]|uniref:baseplate J/gp47 family protein n=1 Tax=Gluconobacter cadivus TaxID=2728101 RepID=UPI001885678A|nr:baseplate J/gp47 family protein [Gluconobacter cadivus]MBF0892211.1 baseplate J/gp47 family protein [Gluconobacter cadivus]
MAFSRPTLTDLRQQALQDIQNGGINGVTAVLRFSVLYVLAMVLAGLAHLHYGYLDWIAKQAVPWTATGIFLEAWGGLKKITRKSATFAAGQVSFVATGIKIVPAGTTIQITGGLPAVSTSDSVTANGVTVVPCTVQAAGAAGNVAAGTTAILGSPVDGIQTTGSVTLAFTGGADIENDSDLRGRILDAFAEGGENGASKDYVKWAKGVSGVTRAWVNPNGYGAGTVVVYIAMDNVRSAQGGLPQGTDGSATGEKRYVTATGDQLIVANALSEERPVTALVIVCAPAAQPVDFTISDLGDSNTPSNQALIKSALQDMFTRLSSPGATLYQNTWMEALGALDLEQFSVPFPAESVVAANVGSMPTLGAINFES